MLHEWEYFLQMQVAVAKLFGVNAVCNPVKSTGMYRITEVCEIKHNIENF